MAALGVGLALRRERIKQELTLDQIAEKTKISRRFLDAMESGDFEQLPGLVFARNFVRQYAAVLKLDPEPLLADLPRIDIAGAPMPDPPARDGRSGWDPRWNSAFASVAWLVLALAAGTGAWIYFNRPPAPKVEVPPQKSAATPVPSVAAAAPVIAPPPPQRDAPHRAVEVVLTAREPSWIQVTADGKSEFTGILQANDSKSIAADSLVKVVTGNAGGIAVSLNGKTLEPLGPAGQVRVVRLTAEGPQFAAKTPPPQPDPL